MQTAGVEKKHKASLALTPHLPRPSPAESFLVLCASHILASFSGWGPQNRENWASGQPIFLQNLLGVKAWLPQHPFSLDCSPLSLVLGLWPQAQLHPSSCLPRGRGYRIPAHLQTYTNIYMVTGASESNQGGFPIADTRKKRRKLFFS